MKINDLKMDGPPAAPKDDLSVMYDVPDKVLRSVKERESALNQEDFEYTVSVKNEHNYKGTRVVLLLLLLSILVLEFVITFVVMKEVRD